MQRLFWLLSFCLFNLFLSAQDAGKYWVVLRDKGGAEYSTDRPLAFLSPASFERRLRQGIRVDESDLPVSESYVTQIASTGAKIRHSSKWFNSVSVEIHNAVEWNRISALSFVARIEPLEIYHRPKNAAIVKEEPVIAVNFLPFSTDKYGNALNQLTMMGGDTIHAMGFTGKGMRIGIFDAGFTRADKIDFFDKMRSEGRLHPVWNYVYDTSYVFRGSSHGMFCLSIIGAHIPGLMIGSAPDADYYLFVTEDERSESPVEEDNWVAAAEKADSIGIDVFSTSLGYTTFDIDSLSHTYAELNGHTTLITRAANKAASKGILVFNSAGNEGASSWHYISAPADADSIISVGSVNSSGILSGFSSRGPNSAGKLKPNVCAQGQGTTIVYDNSLVGSGNGTSFSCPLLAGLSTCFWQAFPNKSAWEIKTEIEASANRHDNPDNNYGYGIPDFYKAFQRVDQSNLLGVGVSQYPLLFPNPVKDLCWLYWYAYDDEKLDIRIYDQSGNSIAQKEIQASKNTVSRILLSDMEQLRAGVYTLVVLHADKKFTSKLFKN